MSRAEFLIPRIGSGNFYCLVTYRELLLILKIFYGFLFEKSGSLKPLSRGAPLGWVRVLIDENGSKKK